VKERCSLASQATLTTGSLLDQNHSFCGLFSCILAHPTHPSYQTRSLPTAVALSNAAGLTGNLFPRDLGRDTPNIRRPFGVDDKKWSPTASSRFIQDIRGPAYKIPYDILAIMPNLRWTYDGPLIYQTSYEKCSANSYVRFTCKIVRSAEIVFVN